MRFSSKPVSSPGRAENYPPVLMRFLRSNVSSRSRGRSRSSPMFIRRKNTPAETQEPSSPKVTCMGQVRMSRSKKPKPRPGRPGAGGIPPPQRPEKRRRRKCTCVQNAFLCRFFAAKRSPKRFNPVWNKWVSFSHAGFPRKSEKRSSSSRSEPIVGQSAVEPGNQKEEEEEVEDEARSIKSFASSPPRNALLLTRCRSAPYRSSSLAGRFWGSPISGGGGGGGGQEQGQETVQIQKRQHQQDNDSNAVSQKESVSGESTTEVAETERFKDPIKESERESEESGEAKPEVLGSSARRCLLLMRCKSEPARTGERLVPELGVWKDRRLGFT